MKCPTIRPRRHPQSQGGIMKAIHFLDWLLVMAMCLMILLFLIPVLIYEFLRYDMPEGYEDERGRHPGREPYQR